MSRGRVLPALAVTLVTWASAFVFIRIALPTLGVAGLTVGRIAVAGLTLATLSVYFRPRRPERRDLLRLIACGITGMLGYQLLLNTGELTVPAGTASLIMSAVPVFAAVLAAVALGESLSARRATGVVLGFAGASIMALSHSGTLSLDRGGLLVLAAAACQASYFVIQKPLLARYTGFEVTTYATWIAGAFAVPLLPVAATGFAQASPQSLGAVVYLGAVASAVGFVTWSYAQARLPVATAANALYLIPLIAIAIGFLVLGETVAPIALLGGLLAMFGVWLARASTR